MSASSEGHEPSAAEEEALLLRSIAALGEHDVDAAILAGLEGGDEPESAEDVILRQLALTLKEDSLVTQTEAVEGVNAADDETNPALLRALALLMGEEEPVGTAEEAPAEQQQPSAAESAAPAAETEASVRERLIAVKRHAVALKREGRIAEARAALGQIKELQAALDEIAGKSSC